MHEHVRSGVSTLATLATLAAMNKAWRLKTGLRSGSARHTFVGSVVAFGCCAVMPAAAQSLCAAPEQVVFACATSGGKLVSLCADAAGVVYRFGRPSRIELTLRDPGPGQPYAFEHYHYGRAGVDRSSVSIETPDAGYEVFSEYEAPQRPTAGVRVTVKATQRQATLNCTGRVEAHWLRLEGKVACSDEAMNSCTPPAARPTR